VRDDLTGAAKNAAAEVAQLNDLLVATPSAQLEKVRDDMLILVDALERGTVSEETYLEAVAARLHLTADTVQQKLSDIDQFAVEAARNIQDAFADFLFDPFKDGVDKLAENFGAAIRRMIANAVARQRRRRRPRQAPVRRPRLRRRDRRLGRRGPVVAQGGDRRLVCFWY